LPPPDVAVVDSKSGLMERDWYDFFRENLRPSLVNVLASSGTIFIDAQSGESQIITPTAAITLGAPLHSRTGQILTITLVNTGSMGSVTWDPIFKMATPITLPANGFSRSFSFTFNGSNWVERFRSAADIAN
jgi:hypothetical protein